MKLDSAINILKEEYSKNKTFDLTMVSDRLKFLVALTLVEQSLNNGSLKESEYINQVTGAVAQ
jgi:hypothetical protein